VIRDDDGDDYGGGDIERGCQEKQVRPLNIFMSFTCSGCRLLNLLMFGSKRYKTDFLFVRFLCRFECVLTLVFGFRPFGHVKVVVILGNVKGFMNWPCCLE